MDGFVGIGADARYAAKLIEMQSSADIPRRWHGTPIEHFIQAQNFGYPLFPHQEPQILISACIEFRYSLPVPSNYAYVIRNAGGRLIGAEFAVGYVLARGVKNILLIAHNDCGMASIGDAQHSADVIASLQEQGWSRAAAERFVKEHVARYAMTDELDALEQEYHRLKSIFRKVHVAPLFLTLSDKRVYLPKWYHEFLQSDSTQSVGTVDDAVVAKLP